MKKQYILIIKIFLSAAILAILFIKIPVTEIASSLSSANLVYIAAGFLIYLIYHFLSAVETSYLTNVQVIKISSIQILKIHFVTMFYNLFLPGLISGGAVKWYKLSKFGSKADAAAVVAFNRFLETLMIVITGIIFSIPVIINTKYHNFIYLLLILLVIILVTYFLILNDNFLNLLNKIVLKIPLPLKVKEAFSKLIISMNKFRKLTIKENIQIFSLLFFYHILGFVVAYLLAISLNINLTFFDIAWMRAAINILTMLPISFAGLGVREVSLVFFMENYGVKPDTAIAYSLLIFFNALLISLIGGLLELINLLTDKKVISERETGKYS